MNSVEPIREIKTIKNIRSILKGQSVRNELLFIFGINVGLRISDILKLKIGDLVKSNLKTVRDYVIITEKKTVKTKKFYIGDIVKKVIENYIKELSNLDMNNYVFQSRKGENIYKNTNIPSIHILYHKIPQIIRLIICVLLLYHYKYELNLIIRG
ncbi:tyrosine-type recombinase/integrase [Clostridium sp. FP2]|uniref:tyrosine-type recombinase/integrase n=1 Tax=Clostridium sp. FP2 TaxID=2724481 RepID=UPI0013E93DE4|nr:tyrosine-type recombinase/integrase [Clostridium sp. FP2]MBZ9626366.1 tyrosine-type recombinase/integrase [Clostridium sp. FP2]